MKWEGNRQSDNIEDRRSSAGGFGIGGRGIGIGTVIVALVGGLMFGIDPFTMLSIISGGGGTVQEQGPAPAPPPNDKRAAFVSTVLADTEDVWTEVLRRNGGTYPVPKLVLFRGAVLTSCGQGSAAMGPFYCPEDQRIYIDLDFFDTMANRLGAAGDFAQAYVIAHEVGHHVQNLLGISAEVNRAQGHMSRTQANALSVRIELQADCFAGVWTHHSQKSKGWLEQGDIEEALNAAAQIGDDALQQKTESVIVPESFTHGTSEQRVRWFTRGLQTGSITQCDTLGTKQL
ncbi:MAG: neutral zinc metallopeptidase [Nitrosospira sp.]